MTIQEHTHTHAHAQKVQCLVKLEFTIESESSETMLNCAIAPKALIIVNTLREWWAVGVRW